MPPARCRRLRTRRSPWSSTSTPTAPRPSPTPHASTGPSPDPVPANNTGTVTRTPGQQADLAIQKTSTNTFIPGRTGHLPVHVHNFGPSFADAPDPDHRHPARRPHLHRLHLGHPGLDLLGRRPGRHLHPVRTVSRRAARHRPDLGRHRPRPARQHPNAATSARRPPTRTRRTTPTTTTPPRSPRPTWRSPRPTPPARPSRVRTSPTPSRPEQRTVGLLRPRSPSSTPCRSA